MKEKKKCEKMISHGFNAYQCLNNAKVERNGVWYCGIHDPVRRKEKQDARMKKWDDEWEILKKADRRRIAEIHYCENLSTEYLETHQAEIEME